MYPIFKKLLGENTTAKDIYIPAITTNKVPMIYHLLKKYDIQKNDLINRRYLPLIMAFSMGRKDMISFLKAYFNLYKIDFERTLLQYRFFLKEISNYLNPNGINDFDEGLDGKPLFKDKTCCQEGGLCAEHRHIINSAGYCQATDITTGEKQR